MCVWARTCLLHEIILLKTWYRWTLHVCNCGVHALTSNSFTPRCHLPKHEGHGVNVGLFEGLHVLQIQSRLQHLRSHVACRTDLFVCNQMHLMELCSLCNATFKITLKGECCFDVGKFLVKSRWEFCTEEGKGLCSGSHKFDQQVFSKVSNQKQICFQLWSTVKLNKSQVNTNKFQTKEKSQNV